VTRVRVALLSAAALGAAALVSGCGAGQISQTADMQPAVPGANSTVGPSADGSIQLRNVLIEYPGVDGYRQGENAPLQLSIFNTGRAAVTLVRVETDAAAAVTLQGGPIVAGTAAPSPGATAAQPHNPPVQTTGIPEASPSKTPSAPASESPEETSSPTPSESAPTAPSGAGSPATAGGGPVSVTVPPNSYVALSSAAGATLRLEQLSRAIRPGEAVTMTFVFDNGARYTFDVPVGLPSAPAPAGSVVPGVRGGEGAPGGQHVGGE